MIRLVLEQPAVGESGQILVRAKLRALADRMDFPALKREHMELVCTEILTNQQKHAPGNGLLQIWESTFPGRAIDLFALDFGGGISDVARAYEDGFTTTATMGKGLGTIQRLSDESAVYSVFDRGEPLLWHGTAVWARFHLDPEPPHCRYQVGMFLRAYRDALHNGDRICVHCGAGRMRWLLMDGLGHGEAAERAVTGIENLLNGADKPQGVMEQVSAALKHGRGAVGVVAEIDLAARRAQLCGIGDVSAAIITAGTRHKVTFAPGVLGHQHRKLATNEFALGEDAVLLTASDGLRRNWDDENFPGLCRLHPQIIALLLGNLVGRVNDDKSIVVVRPAAAQ